MMHMSMLVLMQGRPLAGLAVSWSWRWCVRLVYQVQSHWETFNAGLEIAFGLTLLAPSH